MERCNNERGWRRGKGDKKLMSRTQYGEFKGEAMNPRAKATTNGLAGLTGYPVSSRVQCSAANAVRIQSKGGGQLAVRCGAPLCCAELESDRPSRAGAGVCLYVCVYVCECVGSSPKKGARATAVETERVRCHGGANSCSRRRLNEPTQHITLLHSPLIFS